MWKPLRGDILETRARHFENSRKQHPLFFFFSSEAMERWCFFFFFFSDDKGPMMRRLDVRVCHSVPPDHGTERERKVWTRWTCEYAGAFSSRVTSMSERQGVVSLFFFSFFFLNFFHGWRYVFGHAKATPSDFHQGVFHSYAVDAQTKQSKQQKGEKKKKKKGSIKG